MVRLRHSQRNLGEVFFARAAESPMEAWMKESDEILDDEPLAEVVLRLMVLKHARNWSYEVLEREVKANLVYRMFTRIGTETVPDAKRSWDEPWGAKSWSRFISDWWRLPINVMWWKGGGCGSIQP